MCTNLNVNSLLQCERHRNVRSYFEPVLHVGPQQAISLRFQQSVQQANRIQIVVGFNFGHAEQQIVAKL